MYLSPASRGDRGFMVGREACYSERGSDTFYLLASSSSSLRRGRRRRTGREARSGPSLPLLMEQAAMQLRVWRTNRISALKDLQREKTTQENQTIHT